MKIQKNRVCFPSCSSWLIFYNQFETISGPFTTMLFTMYHFCCDCQAFASAPGFCGWLLCPSGISNDQIWTLYISTILLKPLPACSWWWWLDWLDFVHWWWSAEFTPKKAFLGGSWRRSLVWSVWWWTLRSADIVQKSSQPNTTSTHVFYGNQGFILHKILVFYWIFSDPPKHSTKQYHITMCV